jgi:hypothetical protein
MVARNALGSNSRLLLEARRGRAEFRVLWDILSIGVWREIFVEPLDSRGEAMGTPPLTPRSYPLYRLLRWRAAQVPQEICEAGCLFDWEDLDWRARAKPLRCGQARDSFDTVEVWGSSPHVPTIFFNRLAILDPFFVAPKRSINGLSSCFFKSLP